MMYSTGKMKLPRLVCAVCVVSAVALCLTAGVATAGNLRQDPLLGYTAPSEELGMDLPDLSGVNAAGQTFGVLNDSDQGEMPDLILAAATNGKTGYILKSDLEEATRANLSSDEALALQKSYDAIAADMLQAALSEDVFGGELTDEGAAEIVKKMHVGDSPEIDYEAIAEEAADDFVATARSGIDESTLPDAERIEDAYAEIVLKTTKYIPVYESDGVTVIGEYPVTQM